MGTWSIFRSYLQASPPPLIEEAQLEQFERRREHDSVQAEERNRLLSESEASLRKELNENRGENARQRADIHRLMQMLDNVSNVVMLCDTTHENRVFYMNRFAREAFAKYRQGLNLGLRGADVGRAEGNSIHQYHRDPDHIRRILADPHKLPHHADIPIGETIFRTSTYPIWEAEDPGKVLCYMACWIDVTADRKLAEEKERMQDRQRYLEKHLSQIASAMHEMSATIRAVAENTREASVTTEGVTATAAKGQRIVNQAMESMQQITAFVRSSSDLVSQLGEKSENIGKVVEVIDEIADQTNLLALNAAIEAARAGELGRGFAVVASEVRKLAERTRDATHDIAEMITEIQRSAGITIKTMDQGHDQVRAGEVSSREAEHALVKIVTEIDNVRGMIAQIASATEQQSAATQEIASAVENLMHR